MKEKEKRTIQKLVIVLVFRVGPRSGHHCGYQMSVAVGPKNAYVHLRAGGLEHLSNDSTLTS